MEAVQAQTIDMVKRMKEITLMMQTPEQVLEAQGVASADLEGMLDELQEHVESIDMANDLHSIGGFPPLLNYLKNSHANIRAKAAEVVTTIVQDNPKSQQLVMEANGLEYKFLATEESYAHPIYKRKLVEYDRTAFSDILAMQDGSEHHIVFWRHLSSMSGSLFLIIKQKPISKSLVEQEYMTG